MAKIDFSKPRLQSFNGIFLIFITDLAKRIKQNIYILAIPFLQNNLFKDYGTYIYIGLALLVILQFVFSYLSYKKFKFSIQEDAFHLDSGVIKLSHIEIPFERIQNINLQQNVLQQLLNVVGFEIETAGEGTAEIKIKALDKEFATSLKTKLIEEKNKLTDEDVSLAEDEESDEIKDQTDTEEEDLLFALNFKTLIKVGISSNLFKGVGLLLAFLAYLYNFIMDFLTAVFDLNLEEDFKNRIPETLSFLSAILIAVIILGFLITVLSTVLKYYNLKIFKNQQNFEVEYGLFKRVNKVIKKTKTQIFEIRTNPIKKLFKIRSVFVSQAASKQLTEKQKIGLVGLSKENLRVLFKSLFQLELNDLVYELSRSQGRLFFRYFYKNLILMVILTAVAYFFYLNWLSITGLVIVFLGLTGIAYLKVKKSSIGVNADLISIRKGSIDTRFDIIEIHKLHSVRLSRNIFQQYNGHADLVVETAAGTVNVEYLKYDEAVELLNYLLYKIESTTDKSWI
ncbi:PH domain-containing protein [Psychroflexus sp. YR1-1]|uniref:PH domain-containing protein n=1 Tax=Psychroflexus aurantiacus TaxID=2709310 RepID=A0A6B3R0U7_9FLAO|nr:PH domain-containing protein [Psychroflexus aurantiacus]NEV94189.1 PH domain-containing protein [Psychroflexus aurantiacus]